MLRFKADKYVAIAAVMVRIRAVFARLEKEPKEDLKAELLSLLESSIKTFDEICLELGLPLTKKKHDELMLTIVRSRKLKIDKKQVEAEITELCSRFEDELSLQYFVSLSPKRAEYLDQAEPFGNVVSERFPGAIDDIEGAAKCLALEQATASVLHLMRVIEVGLKELARSLGIPYAPSWESYLIQIQARIAAKHKKKGIKWKRDEAFFRDISGDLISIKQAWRNPTMHVVRKYTPDDSEEIFRATKTFMSRLADGLPKPSSAAP